MNINYTQNGNEVLRVGEMILVFISFSCLTSELNCNFPLRIYYLHIADYQCLFFRKAMLFFKI